MTAGVAAVGFLAVLAVLVLVAVLVAVLVVVFVVVVVFRRHDYERLSRVSRFGWLGLDLSPGRFLNV